MRDHLIQRRAVMAGLVSSFIAGCATMPEDGEATLIKPVKVRRDRILKSVVGLRPHRDGGFRLETAPLQGKMLIHNYGHGGDGVSLSHGSASVAAEMAHATGARNTAILGAGVMGLTTAHLLAGWGHKITIFAADMPPNTTSNIAGALIIVPNDFGRSNPIKEILDQDARVSKISTQVWDSMVDRRGYGVKRIDSYHLNGLGAGANLSPEKQFLGRSIRRHRSRVMVDPNIYLAALVRDLKSAGVTFESRRFTSASDIEALPHKTIVNCTGLGGGQLFLDKNVVPIRGQLTLLKPQPEIDYAYLARDPNWLLYMFPRQTSIVLGGTRERGRTHMSIDEDTVERMLRSHGEMAGHAGRPILKVA